MKIPNIFSAVIFISLLFSCNEICTTCQYTVKDIGTRYTTQFYQDPEICGTSEEVKNYKDNSAKLARELSSSSTILIFTCVDN